MLSPLKSTTCREFMALKVTVAEWPVKVAEMPKIDALFQKPA
jgi:hypothetical protein